MFSPAVLLLILEVSGRRSLQHDKRVKASTEEGWNEMRTACAQNAKKIEEFPNVKSFCDNIVKRYDQNSCQQKPHCKFFLRKCPQNLTCRHFFPQVEFNIIH